MSGIRVLAEPCSLQRLLGRILHWLLSLWWFQALLSFWLHRSILCLNLHMAVFLLCLSVSSPLLNKDTCWSYNLEPILSLRGFTLKSLAYNNLLYKATFCGSARPLFYLDTLQHMTFLHLYSTLVCLRYYGPKVSLLIVLIVLLPFSLVFMIYQNSWNGV